MRRVALCGLLLLAARPALAGMPMIVLSDIATLRLRAISFFLVVFLLVAAAVRLLWNFLRTSFPGMPPLSFGRALALMVLWGLAFNLVLTMISGARELMTPGAWVKSGATYRLASEPPRSTPPPSPEPARQEP